MKFRMVVTGHGEHSCSKNGGNRPRGCAPGRQNVFFLLSMQRGLSATYPAPISTIFEAAHESFSVCVHRWKIFQFLRRGFSGSLKKPKVRYSRVGCLCVCAGLMYDVTGSYRVGFIILACIALIALSLMTAIIIIERRTRKLTKTSNTDACIVVQSQPVDTKCWPISTVWLMCAIYSIVLFSRARSGLNMSHLITDLVYLCQRS